MTRMLQLTPTGIPAILPSRMFWFILVPSPSDHARFRPRMPGSSGSTDRGWSRSRCLSRVLACQQVPVPGRGCGDGEEFVAALATA